MVVVVKHLVKENDNTENTITKLTTTKYGTIIGDNGFEETTVEKFIKSLEKGINNEEEDIKKSDSNDLEYIINDNSILTINQTDHYYPIIKEKLNELCEKSCRLDKNNHTNLKELNIEKKKILKYLFLGGLGIMTIPTSIVLFVLLFTNSINVYFSILAIILLGVGTLGSGIWFDITTESFLELKDNKEKIEIAKRKLKYLENEKNINLVSSEKEILKLDSNNDKKYIPNRTECKEPVRQGVKKKELTLHHKRS